MNLISASPYIRFLRPKVSSWYQQTCNLRNSMKIGKDIYELAIDVRHFCKNELTIKARPDRILIEGKNEKKLDEGVIVRAFSRKYKLPSGVDPKRIQSELSKEGLLTIKAPRDVNYVANEEFLCETDVPIVIQGTNAAEIKAKETCGDQKSIGTPKPN